MSFDEVKFLRGASAFFVLFNKLKEVSFSLVVQGLAEMLLGVVAVLRGN
jgi:hypothetical protein